MREETSRTAKSTRSIPPPKDIAEANPHVAIEKAERELGWRADFRLLPR